jgi:hypothetical protein
LTPGANVGITAIGRMALVTQAAFARHRGVSREAVRKRTVTAGGPLPVYGPRKLLDLTEADALWVATMSPQGMANTNGNGAAPPSTGSELVRARTAALTVDIEVKRLALAKLRGELISRDAAVRKAFAFGRLWRDAWFVVARAGGSGDRGGMRRRRGHVDRGARTGGARPPDRARERTRRVLAYPAKSEFVRQADEF